MVTAAVVDEVRYPIGEIRIDPEITPEKRKMWIQQMAEAPAKLRTALLGLSEEQLDTRYRNDGWTLRQVVHHLAGPQLNGFTRFKLALTEDRPAIKTYEEDLWSQTPDGRDAPVNLSVDLLTALHARWVILLKSLTAREFARTFSHPQRGELRIDDAIQLYAWHGIHHTAHITRLRERKGW